MNRHFIAVAFSLVLALSSIASAQERKLRIICFGAHPDDCELQAGGTAALWAARGHKVKFVSVTNGDIGHWRDAGGPLARRRKMETDQADGILGVATEILDLVNLISTMSRSESPVMESAIYSLAEDLWGTDRERAVPLTPIEQTSPSSRRIFNRSAGSNWKTA